MQYPETALTKKDLIIWQRYVTRLLNSSSDITPKYTYSEATSRKLDLHGYTVNDAWLRFREFIDQHHKNGSKSVVIITGKNGQIAHEFREWCKLIPMIRNYEPLGTNNGPAGSFRVNFKKQN